MSHAILSQLVTERTSLEEQLTQYLDTAAKE